MLYIVDQNLASLYGSGTTNCLVFNVWEGVTITTPIYQGYIASDEVQRLDFDGL